ncbi:hypothetical protein CRG98_026036 [Punica granatum]|uniref:Uncharacterized protein n=1 Tax=Punica granatum TaxID=22663 RepID=A0A2I0JD46_PUNGR|nr:hypothetical protein CRG98_026036 [Punica granatum]
MTLLIAVRSVELPGGSWAAEGSAGPGARASWAGRAGAGPRRGAGPRKAVAGPNLRANWVARSGPNPRRGETGRASGLGRVVSVGLGRTGWTDSTGLDQLDWAGPAQTEKMGRARERENTGEDEVGRRRGIRRPRIAASAFGYRGDSAGDGDEHRLDYAVLGMGVTRLGSVGIEGNFRFWRGFFEFSGEGFPEFNCRKSGELRGGNRGILLRGVSRVRSRREIRARGKDFRAFERDPNRESRERESESEIGTVRAR